MSTYSGGVKSVMVTMEVTRAVFQGVCTRNDTYHQESGGRDREKCRHLCGRVRPPIPFFPKTTPLSSFPVSWGCSWHFLSSFLRLTEVTLTTEGS